MLPDFHTLAPQREDKAILSGATNSCFPALEPSVAVA